MIFVNYYTIDTPYESEAMVLRESLAALGLRYDLQGVPRFESWQKATQHKADFIRSMMVKHSGERIVWIDADSIVLRRPDLLIGTIAGDVAAVIFPGDELLSGVVAFEPSAIPLVDHWLRINAQYPETLPDGREAWDQRTLHMAIRETGAKFVELPSGYNYIVGLSQERYPSDDIRIVATRGAFRFKQEIDRG